MLIDIEVYSINSILKELLSFIIAFCVGIFLITYLLNLPTHITKSPKIVNEYYSKNFLKNVPLDLFFIFVYFLVVGIIIKLLNIKCYMTKLLIVAIVTALITGYFFVYFTSRSVTSNFFSKWFHTVGYTSIIYDVILLVFIYAVFLFIKSKTSPTKNKQN
tara:strand:+ start:8 stop:487 length:480 start_codon:yes stop_codon:yes gene_type:complete